MIVSYVLEGLLGLFDGNLLIIDGILGVFAGIACGALGLFLLLAVPATAWRGIAQHGLFSRRWLAKSVLCLVTQRVNECIRRMRLPLIERR